MFWLLHLLHSDFISACNSYTRQNSIRQELGERAQLSVSPLRRCCDLENNVFRVTEVVWTDRVKPADHQTKCDNYAQVFVEAEYASAFSLEHTSTGGKCHRMFHSSCACVRHITNKKLTSECSVNVKWFFFSSCTNWHSFTLWICKTRSASRTTPQYDIYDT